MVPPASEHPRLRYWHWFSLSNADYGEVQLRVGTGSWRTISETYSSTSAAWSYASVDLSEWSDSTVEIAFYLHAQEDGNWTTDDVSSGWYVDEVAVITGSYVFDGQEDFASGIGDWSVDGGVWEVGMPQAGIGPGSAHSDSICAGTVLGGNYPMWQDTRLKSAPFVVPPASQHPRLRYWHWYSLSNADYAYLQLRVNGGPWQTVQGSFWGYSGAWSYASADLSEWADSAVEIAFYLHAQEDGNWTTDDVSSGWYVDDVSLVTGNPVFNNPEDFEAGIGDWSVDGGVWEVGTPAVSVGPGAAHQGSCCAGTVLDGNYPMWQDTRLKSATFVVPPALVFPRLLFWHWFCFSAAELRANTDQSGPGILTGNGCPISS